MSLATDAQFATNFPGWVMEQVGIGYVLVAKNTMDFDFCKPSDLGGAHEHVSWFHNFWWINNADTKTKLVAFFDTKKEAIRAGEKMCMGYDGHLYNWAVYDSAGVIQDGKY
jgi:hypothetical protein